MAHGAPGARGQTVTRVPACLSDRESVTVLRRGSAVCPASERVDRAAAVMITSPSARVS